MTSLADALGNLESHWFVGRVTELGRFRKWLGQDRPTPSILDVHGPGGVGKSALLAAFKRVALEQSRDVVLLDGHTAGPTSSAWLRALCQAMDAPAGSSIDDLAIGLNQRHAVLLIDTFEDLVGLTDYLLRDFLPRLSIDVKIVIAGRSSLGRVWEDHGIWRSIVESMQLEVLSAVDSSEYLRRRGVTDAAAITEIVGETQGHPLSLSLAADLAVRQHALGPRSQPRKGVRLGRLIDRALRDLTTPDLRSLLDVCAIVRQFDEPLLEAVSGIEDIRTQVDELRRWSAIRPASHGLALHDSVRAILLDDLQERNQPRLTELRRRALAYYRSRMERASVLEREWLLGERFALWENAWVQSTIFHEDEPGSIWMEDASLEDESTAMDIEMFWRFQVMPHLADVDYRDDPDGALHRQEMLRFFHCPGRRMRIARDRDGNPLGYLLVLPIYQGSLKVLDSSPLHGIVQAHLGDATASLPEKSDETNVYFIVQGVHRGERANDVNGALFRDLFTVFARGGLYFSGCFLDVHVQLWTTLGFHEIPHTARPIWSDHILLRGFALDLQTIGVDAWIESLMSGDPPPRTLSIEEVERALQAALPHWTEDRYLSGSELLKGGLAIGLTFEKTPSGLRQAVDQLIREAHAQANSDDLAALDALVRAYLPGGVSLERAAREAHVSRSTFFRLLRRGRHLLARMMSA